MANDFHDQIHLQLIVRFIRMYDRICVLLRIVEKHITIYDLYVSTNVHMKSDPKMEQLIIIKLLAAIIIIIIITACNKDVVQVYRMPWTTLLRTLCHDKNNTNNNRVTHC